MLRHFEYSRLIEKVTTGKNVNLWGKACRGKTFTVKSCLLKDINIESVYLDLAYPFCLDKLFKVISISFGLYYQLDWHASVQHLSLNHARLLVIDNFDRLHCASEKFSEDLFSLQMLALLDNLSLLTISRMPLRYFHFSSFADCFEELEVNESNSHIF
ncbi:ATP-binding protein [Iningainema tapete]|uniref:ATP-binding protein n=1 Tax=Iningainema tapete BLCC-T55 TaxID=2748662 RepID=A0A8J6XH94_9CYAN|nr:ATP-binding protein [Iningainema tapete]MBD2772121.1 ATP-binding protein [Iningainema tapete BLCC-T55]